MYEQLIGFLPEEERNDPINGYYKRLASGDQKLAAAKEWMRWALTLDSFKRDEGTYDMLDEPEECLAGALMEAHYFKHGAWLKEGQLLSDMGEMKDIDGKSSPTNVTGSNANKAYSLYRCHRSRAI